MASPIGLVIKGGKYAGKTVKKLLDSIDDKATDIPGRKVSSSGINVGKERLKRTKRKEKVKQGSAASAGSTVPEILEIFPEGTKGEISSLDNVSSKMKNTIRGIEGTPAEERRRNSKVAKRKMGGKVKSKSYKHGGKLGCGAAIKGYGKGPYKKKGM